MIIAGEASGDLHGAGVVRELRRIDPSCELFGIGGDRMQAAGMQLLYHVRELSVMGIWEVLRHLPLLRSVERTLGAVLRGKRPDAVLLIDYPGLNLRIAAAARQAGVPVLYYIGPQVWAWHAGRIGKMKEAVDKIFVVFPFEEELYRKNGIDAEFVGHPLLDVMGEPQEGAAFRKRHGFSPGGLILGLFPGSRRQEIERILPAMLGAVRILRDAGRAFEAGIGVSPSLEPGYVESFLRDEVPVRLVYQGTYDLMHNADAAIVTSGTATLETALSGTPMVVVYKTSLLTYVVGRLLVRIRNIGLVNIVAGKRIVPELIQGAASPEAIAREAAAMLDDAALRTRIRGELAGVRAHLGEPGAALRVAQGIAAVARARRGGGTAAPRQ